MTIISRLKIAAWVRNVLLALVAIAAFVQTGIRYDWDASDWASWVQALGSIAAIVGLIWATMHATANARREAERNAREDSITHLIFFRSVLSSVDIIARDLDYYAENIKPQKVEMFSKSLRPFLATIEALAIRVNDHQIGRLVALTYEHLVLFQLHAQFVKPNSAAGLVEARTFAAFNRMHIKDALAELDQIGSRLGAPPRPVE